MADNVIPLRRGRVEVRASALQQIVGLSAQRIRELAGEGVVVRTRHGYYDLAASVQGLATYWRTRAAAAATEDGRESKLRDLELREREARTLIAELAYSEKVGELFPACFIADRWHQVHQAAESQFRRLPGKWRRRHRLPPDVVKDLADDLTDALNEIARSDPFPPTDATRVE